MKVLKSLIRIITTKMNNSQKIDALFQPNELGVSRRVSIEEVITAGIRWSNNGNIRNGIPFNSKRYVWDVFRQNPEKRTSKVVELQMIGLRDDPSKDRPIRDDIRLALENQPCVSCGKNKSEVVDHKNDLYNDPRVLSRRTQVLSDFQALCNHCNLVKRTHTMEACATGKRYSALRHPSIGQFGIAYTQGGESFDVNDPDAFVGTYWHDPVSFVNHCRARDIQMAWQNPPKNVTSS